MNEDEKALKKFKSIVNEHNNIDTNDEKDFEEWLEKEILPLHGLRWGSRGEIDAMKQSWIEGRRTLRKKISKVIEELKNINLTSGRIRRIIEGVTDG
jgi:hypothetical protein